MTYREQVQYRVEVAAPGEEYRTLGTYTEPRAATSLAQSLIAGGTPADEVQVTILRRWAEDEEWNAEDVLHFEDSGRPMQPAGPQRRRFAWAAYMATRS